MSSSLNSRLDKVEMLAKSSKFSRLLSAPYKYLNGQFYSKIAYPFLKKGLPVVCNTFFDTRMNLVLPAGMDIYLCGGKSHDSEIRLTRFMLNTIKENDVIIDVGAHFGFYSLLASKLVGSGGTVISFEASKEIFRMLNRNTDPHSNIQTFNIACSDRNESIQFYEFPILFSEYNSITPEQYKGTSWIGNNAPRQINVEGRTLDDMLTQMKLKPDFIKIDVEGAEKEVVIGMARTLSETGQLLISMEYHADERKNKAHKEATNILMDKSYLANIVNEKGELETINSSKICSYLLNTNLDSDNIIFKRA